MDTVDRTKERLLERIDMLKQMLQEAEAALNAHRDGVEIQRQIALDHAIAVVLQDFEKEDPYPETGDGQNHHEPRDKHYYENPFDNLNDPEDDERYIGAPDYAPDYAPDAGQGPDSNHRTTCLRPCVGYPVLADTIVGNLSPPALSRLGLNDPVCVSCMNSVHPLDACRRPCSHHWCPSCTAERCELSLRSADSFPAECCGEPFRHEEIALVSIDLYRRYLHAVQTKAALESRNPVYCFRPGCSRLVPRDKVKHNQAECVCGHVTCAACKAKSHDGECVVDEATVEILKMSEEQKWQQCVQCKAMVEKIDGCNHITCRCLAQFCYICGKEWKTCLCPLFDEDDYGNLELGILA